MRLLILSGVKSLQTQIGNTIKLEKAVRSFMKIRKDYQAKFIYYDQPNEFGVTPVKKKAQSIRSFIRNIEKKWGFIDILLLLGGDTIVPFFRLKNPCDDSDTRVFSDNPYASSDDDFLIPERVCARIPDNKDATFIINQLEKSVTMTHKSFGMTARVWRAASRNVYRSIGNINDIKVSPPVTGDTFKSVWLQRKDFLYFNLHGSKLSSHWYGQDKGMYPVALRPDNVDKAQGVVASEACYGAYIMEKSHKNALSLKFLSEKGIYGFCGSTTIAYGPAAPPSSEADLLVKYFLEYTKQGLTLGESFKSAKIDFVRKALRRNGFLDDDDQKTVLQFVLYGDPTLRFQTKIKKSVKRKK
ncbi:hypothetical protein AMJ52_04020 [candidate division TA06 bacterium DG_78]|uniref:Gingipain domain-containing protein n=1 Tax=candidate division TA06 bacterium DG_78 TaxID=1703772 RepID=A0A0S7YEM1_UNCT6|nr:MAG: hypothetical protein AMJ52_04020 [candidate division TA06 bacterium DG_78]